MVAPSIRRHHKHNINWPGAARVVAILQATGRPINDGLGEAKKWSTMRLASRPLAGRADNQLAINFSFNVRSIRAIWLEFVCCIARAGPLVVERTRKLSNKKSRPSFVLVGCSRRPSQAPESGRPDRFCTPRSMCPSA